MIAVAHLQDACPNMAKLIGHIGIIKPAKPAFAEPYEALISAIAHQQLHGKAAVAILNRLMAHNGGAIPPPAMLRTLPDEVLKGCGFSGSKVLALRDIASKAETIPTRRQALRLSDEALIERLTALRGVGRWTVEMLLIFTLRRADVFPVDDFGVREGYRVIHRLEVQPKAKVLMECGRIYAPYRSLAALYLWRAADAAKHVPRGTFLI